MDQELVAQKAAAVIEAWDRQGVHYHQLADRRLLLAIRALREALKG